MRIVGGRFRRATIKAPKGTDVRPTTDRVREAVFNVLHARDALDGALVLDLFAGTGALGFEALSRGAKRAVFVEVASSVLRTTRENANTLGIEEACSFTTADVLHWLGRPVRQPFDLIFADPPYDFEELPSLPALVRPHLAETGLFILEHDARHTFGEEPALLMSRAYGKTVVSMFAA